MSTIVLISLAIGAGYLAALMGVQPIEMFGIVSFSAFVGEYLRRLAYRFLKRRYNG